MEFYNFDNELFKVIEIKSVFPLQDGKYMVKDMIASNLLTQNRKSEILFTNISEGLRSKIPISASRTLKGNQCKVARYCAGCLVLSVSCYKSIFNTTLTQHPATF